MTDGLTRLVPMRVQLQVALTLEKDEEYAGFSSWLVSRLRAAHLDVIDHSDAEMDEFSCGVSGGVNLGDVEYTGKLRVGFPLMQGAVTGAGADLIAHWDTPLDRGPRAVFGIKIANRGLSNVVAACWVWFGPTAGAELIGRAEAAFRSMLIDAVEEWQPSFANLADDNERTGHLALEIAMAGRGVRARSDDRLHLFSYSWTTFVRSDLADRLGGAEGLRASGAFHDVLEVDGGLVVRGTEHLADYVGQRVRDVREALSPVLPTGRMVGPHPGPGTLTAGLRIAWDDGSNGPFGYGRLQGAFDRATQRGRWVVVHG